MTEKELRKLSRADLLEMLIDQSTELQNVRERLAAAEEALQRRELAINTAGSIAEAALQLNHVFEAAEAACSQYTENIRTLSERQESICREMEKKCREKTERQLAETEKRCAALEERTKSQCSSMLEKTKGQCSAMESQTKGQCSAMETQTRNQCTSMVAKAKTDAQVYWDEINRKLDTYYAEHTGLRELLSVRLPGKEQG